jgi:hypothetical protein
MLQEMAAVGGESIVSWQPHGKAFRVHQPEVFARSVMSRYFERQTKYKSFQRQLHLYGFRRISKGIDRGAYFHPMFIRNQKSMSLRMSYVKIKGMSSKAIGHHTSTTKDPDFYCSATNVDNNLPNVLQSNPILQATFTTTPSRTKENCESGCRSKLRSTAAAVFNTGSCDYHADEEQPLLNIALPFFNHQVPGAGPSSSDQLTIDWMEQANTVLSREDEESTPPSNAYDNSAFEKCHAVSTLLLGVNHHRHENEGLFEGKRFFFVAEATTPIIENFSMVVKRGGPMLYVSRSA